MQYDFDQVVDRSKNLSAKYDERVKKFGTDDVIPLWIADMDFRTAQPVIDALKARAEEGIWGYTARPASYFEAVKNWQKRRNGWDIDPRLMSFSLGVVQSISAMVKLFTPEGGSVLIQTPVYSEFYDMTEAWNRKVLENPFVEKDGRWEMDWADFEAKLAEADLFLLCSPHNPCGRVWERWELEKAMELFRKYDVYVVSDEIWSDLLLDGRKHIPTQSVSEDARMRTAALYAPSKTFNLAGLVGSYHIVYNDWWRDRMDRESSLSHYNMMNVLSTHALIGAYQPEGRAWVDELCQVLSSNVAFACDYIQQHFEGVHVARPEGTYMLFVDCTDWCRAHGKTIEDVERACWEVGAAVQDGRMFHGPCHLRMNLASPRSRIEEAFRRMDAYVFNA